MAKHEFHALDEARLRVAQDRLFLESLKKRAKASHEEMSGRLGRLLERDERNGYAEMFRDLLGEEDER